MTNHVCVLRDDVNHSDGCVPLVVCRVQLIVLHSLDLGHQESVLVVLVRLQQHTHTGFDGLRPVNIGAVFFLGIVVIRLPN